MIPRLKIAYEKEIVGKLMNKLNFKNKHEVPKIDKITGSTLLAVHNGKESGQEIPHVHVHLIPRQSNDLAGPVHSMFKNRPNLSDEEFDQLHTMLKSY